ncbi:peptidoglycan synthetase FtsI [Bryocella elongata]|uniref:Peptidoglycan synthetase FtsI n=1 Tax=Bryocella elongata TaxID=863522 RepID=A0A1H6B318_9BACT|nr:penicillin-binding transpeptidase domain-containing protein [Bryocella elongata]SEG54765.1 peptidoglycan synthetase FtsI [Bryocella elongata]
MKPVPRRTLTAPIRRVRFVWVAVFFCFWGLMISLRLGWLQIVRHHEFVERAEKQQQRTFEVAPRRGVLYDRNMRELAMTVLVDSVYAVPSEVGDNRAADAAILAKVIHQDPLDHFTTEQAMLARMNDSHNFAWIARKLDAPTAQRVRELNLKGIYLQKEFKRFYPSGDLAAHVLGYVGTDDDGLGGMEQQFDDELHGMPGHMLTAVDAKRHVLGSVVSEPMPGENLVLTIDSNIQYMAEKALDAQVAKYKAAHGTLVVQDPHTGQILALAISPRFNPNDQRHVDADALTDLAVSDVYEPGSTFKLVTYSAALDAAGVKPTDMVDCQGGSMTMYGRTLHDDKSDHYGVITVQAALEHSSDVGAAKMALKVGNDKFYDYMRSFGFGQRSGIELPSETRGLLRPTRKWSATSVLSLAIGQEVGVTPVQLVSMVSTLANGGTYLPPRLLMREEDKDHDGHLDPQPFHPETSIPSQLPDGAHRVIRESTAAEMRMMMHGIVVEGTGRPAALNGYSAAGKTGTAEKIDPKTHTYSHTKLVASFAGFAPVNNPAIAVAVVIDTPTVGSGYGGETSAPVFSVVAQEILEYLGVPHDEPLKSQKELLAAKTTTEREDSGDEVADLSAMFDDVNSLPQDDPLRAPATAAAMAANRAADAAADAVAQEKADQRAAKHSELSSLSEKALAVFHAGPRGFGAEGSSPDAKVQPVAVQAQVETRGNGSVVVDETKRVAVPQFDGKALRLVVQQAGALGLRVQTLGSGMAREQAPAPGTMVPVGTEVVVRFAR